MKGPGKSLIKRTYL